MAALDKSLAALYTDLEVAARVASVFSAWATYTDGHLIGVDASVTRDYVSILQRFSRMCLVEAKRDDFEERNRTRLIGLGALTGAVTSAALFHSPAEFKAQVSAITPALLLSIKQARLSTLNEEAEIIRMNPSPFSPYLSEFTTRPMAERRAASIHIHIDGDKGPDMGDVANACLRALSSLLNQSNGPQVGYVVQEALNNLEEGLTSDLIEHCCWFAQTAVQWTQYQYRYAVPTRLVERLSQVPDDSSPTPLHKALAAMIRTVFTSPTPLVNLSTSDIISNLISIAFRRVGVNPYDELLPDLVECIAALGAHIYYADQIQDLACELVSRLVALESNGIPGRADAGPKCRSEGVRCLIAGLVGLMRAADKPHTDAKSNHSGEGGGGGNLKLGTTPATLSDATPSKSIKAAPLSIPSPVLQRRTKISPDAWQDTINLLCDVEFEVRADYSRALLLFLRNEIPKEKSLAETPMDESGHKFARPLSIGPLARAQNMGAIVNGEEPTSRFLNALHAAVFVLATSFSLGTPTLDDATPSQSESTRPHVGVSVIPSTPSDMDNPSIATEDPPDTSQQSSSSRRRSVTITPQARKLSVAQRLLDQVATPVVNATASATDYAYITKILMVVHEQQPCRALMTGVPMLIALQKSADSAAHQQGGVAELRRRVLGEVVSKIWLVIGRVWDCPDVVSMAHQALAIESLLPATLDSPVDAIFPMPETSTPFHIPKVLGYEDNYHAFDTAAAVRAMVANRTTQFVTGLDEQALLDRLQSPWTPESALKSSVERSSSHDYLRGDSANPVLKISPALMHIENLSLQSLTRSTRGVGVSDLRDALEGRGGMSSTALASRAASISSLDYAAYSVSSDGRSVEPGRMPRARMKRTFNGESPAEVRDVLNKLGIGPQAENSLLKAPFPALQQPDRRTANMLVPPYKT